MRTSAVPLLPILRSGTSKRDRPFRLKLSLVVTSIRPLGGHRELRPSVRIASWRQGQPNRGGHEYRSVFRSAHIHVV
jgi:hypothetical protein